MITSNLEGAGKHTPGLPQTKNPSHHLQAVLDVHGAREEAGALLKEGGQLVHVSQFVGVLQVLHSQLDGAMVDVVHQQLKYRGTDILKFDASIVRLLQVGGEHRAEEAALGRQYQPVQLELLAVYHDTNIGKKPIFQTQVHDALHHPAGV